MSLENYKPVTKEGEEKELVSENKEGEKLFNELQEKESSLLSQLIDKVKESPILKAFILSSALAGGITGCSPEQRVESDVEYSEADDREAGKVIIDSLEMHRNFSEPIKEQRMIDNIERYVLYVAKTENIPVSKAKEVAFSHLKDTLDKYTDIITGDDDGYTEELDRINLIRDPKKGSNAILLLKLLDANDVDVSNYESAFKKNDQAKIEDTKPEMEPVIIDVPY